MADGDSVLPRIASRISVEPRLGPDLRVERVGAVVEVGPTDFPVVCVEVRGGATADALAPYLVAFAEQRAAVLFVGETGPSLLRQLPPRLLAQIVPDHVSDDALYFALESLLFRLRDLQHDASVQATLARARYELRELTEIGRAITQERDIERLLDIILVKSRFITGADAGSIYVVEGTDPEPTKRRLRFKLSQNDSCQFESKEFTVPISTRSIAGYAAVTKRPIHIPDVAEIPLDSPFSYDPSFDKRVGYRTRSMIAVPMISAEDEVIGVIQLINKKRIGSAVLKTPGDYESVVIPFDERSADLLVSLASQAGIALENALLYDEIRRIFEGFVRASVQAIEQRDPTTSGHSLRVSVLSTRLAQVVDRVDDGPYAEARFTAREIKELEYASLLHDFGKIGVREQVLVKAKKLYPHVLDSVRDRVHYALKAAEADALARKVELLRAGAGSSELDRVDLELARLRAELEDAWKLIRESNEPTVLSEGDFTRIHEVAKLSYVDGGGCSRCLLEPDEVRSLSVRKGSLNDDEMEEIRSHVVHTFDFLRRIPWGKSFARVAEIAGAHHEKLNGNGYPHGKSAEAIPLQSKIMAIADIYDALTARDRPYKKAIPAERALGILGFEVDAGHVDGELVRIFREAHVFREVEKDLAY